MSKYGEIRNDFYSDEEQKVYIDAKTDSYAQEIINETLSNIDNGNYENC